MKVSKKLSNRIKAYGAMGTAMIGADATAAIVYTDVSPDFTGGSDTVYLLDLNNDAVNDFAILNYFYNSNNLLFVVPTTGNEVLGSIQSSYAYPYALDAGNSIGPAASGTWLSAAYQSANYGGVYGNWVNKSDKYLGLKFIVGSDTFYGWCRMTVNQDASSFIIKDYAYENVAGTAIDAGDNGGTVGLRKTLTGKIDLYSSNKSLFVGLEHLTGRKAELTVTDMSGKTVLKEELTVGSRYEIPMDAYRKGMYVATLRTEEDEFAIEKVLID